MVLQELEAGISPDEALRVVADHIRSFMCELTYAAILARPDLKASRALSKTRTDMEVMYNELVTARTIGESAPVAMKAAA